MTGNTLRIVLVVSGGVPLLFVHASWATTALIGYSLTAVLFGILLIGEYPPLGSRWFWKAMIPIIIIHSAIVFGLVLLNLEIPEMNRLPRVVYGFLGIVVAVEWYFSLHIVEAFRPKNA